MQTMLVTFPASVQQGKALKVWPCCILKSMTQITPTGNVPEALELGTTHYYPRVYVYCSVVVAFHLTNENIGTSFLV